MTISPRLTTGDESAACNSSRTSFVPLTHTWLRDQKSHSRLCIANPMAPAFLQQYIFLCWLFCEAKRVFYVGFLWCLAGSSGPAKHLPADGHHDIREDVLRFFRKNLVIRRRASELSTKLKWKAQRGDAVGFWHSLPSSLHIARPYRMLVSTHYGNVAWVVAVPPLLLEEKD